MLARHLDARTVVVYTTVAYATIKNERSLPICSGLNSDLSALSADARGAGPSDGGLGDADNKAWRRTGKGHESNARRDTRDGPPLSGRQNPAVVFARRWQGGRFVLDCKDVAEATSVMEALPLAKERLVNLEFTALTPLTPLRLLLDGQPGRP